MAFDWSREALEKLEKFWLEGVPTAQIGIRLGVSKNAVVGKAHRRGLPPRPNPTAESRRKGNQIAAMRDALADGKSPEEVAQAFGTDVEAMSARIGKQQRRMVEKAAAATLPPLASVAGAGVPTGSLGSWGSPIPRGVVSPVSGAGRAAQDCDDPNAQRLAGVVVRSPAAEACAWPIGEPGTRSYCTCNAPARPGKPYCEEHYRRAYLAPRGQFDAAQGGAHAG